MDTTVMTDARPDFEAIKTRQNAAWSSGDYARIGTTLQIVGETLADAVDADPGARVLDVAAGNGNATLAFARRWCRVTSTDYVDALLGAGAARAKAEGLDVDFRHADAEALPFDDGEFDAVVSSFGVMFTPDQETAAAELLRVCRAGGTIGLANWTPDGFIGNLFKTIGRNVAPPPGVRSPALWGSRDWIVETFGGDAASIDFVPRNFVFRYRSPEHFIEFFRTFYGPLHKAFLALDDAGRTRLHDDVETLIATFNTATDGTMRVPSEYAEIVIAKA